MSLERFCRKGLTTAEPRDTVLSAAMKMRETHVGAIVVVDGGRRPVGILTDRDVICRVVAESRDPSQLPVEAVMSRDVVTVRRTDTIDEVVFCLQRNGVRRVPIVDGEGALVGLAAFDDLVVLLAAELGETVAALRRNRGP